MKREFLKHLRGVDVNLLLTFMHGNIEFNKLDNDAQKVLLWLALNHRDAVNAFTESLSEAYAERCIDINTPELLHDIDEALIFLSNAPRRIRHILNSPDRQKMFESITDFERGSFRHVDLRDHLEDRGFTISDASINILLRALSHHRFLSEFKIGKVTHYQSNLES